MATILGANTLSSGYEVANSCKFETNTYMTKSASSGNQRTFTVSFWAKRSNFVTGNHHYPISFYQDANNRISFAFLSGNSFIIYAESGGSGQLTMQTSALFRDPSAWYHVVIAFDTTQGTDSNRLKLYINGKQITDFADITYPSQNADLTVNTNIYIGTYDTSNNPFHGYLTEFVYIDGLQLDQTSFGEFDSDSPAIWKPIDVSGLTFGTNGFYLDFEDSGNLGNDANGGTDFTETNLVATDQSTDTCTNNFATLNPLTTWMSSDYTLSEGNLKISIGNNTEGKAALATFGLTTGKWYWEVKLISTTGDSYAQIGITDEIYNDADSGSNKQGYGDYDYGYRGEGGGKKVNAGNYVNYGDSYAAGDIIGVALDLDNLAIYFHKNGTYQASGAVGDPTSGASRTNATFNISAASSTASGYYFPVIAKEDADDPIFEFNFGGTNSASFAISSGNADANGYGNFEYAVPSGYYSICTKNLAEFG